MSIEKLQQRMQRTVSMLDQTSERSLLSVSPLLLQKRLGDIEKQHRNATEVQPAQAKTKMAIERLERGDYGTMTPREWGYLAWGICTVSVNGEILITREKSCEIIISHFKRAFATNVRRHTWFGLLFSYFSLDTSNYKNPPRAWGEIRKLLKSSFHTLYNDTKIPRDWMLILNQHPEIIDASPVEKLAKMALSGESSLIANIKKTLRIPGNSWLWSELIEEQLRQVCLFDDDLFINHIETILLSGKEHPSLQNEILQKLLNRYAASNHADIPHDALKITAIEHWGNPQLTSSSRWGIVDDAAKSMIMHWFAKEDLEHFFSLLQEGGSTDKRRLRYWMRFVKQIKYSRIILGDDACFNKSNDFVNFRRVNFGRFSRLTGQTPKSNNAFMILIGEFYIIEFSENGNACYIYSKENLSFHHEKQVQDISAIKNRKTALKWISHNGDWEFSLDSFLNSIGIFPDRTRITSKTVATTNDIDDLYLIAVEEAANWMKSTFINNGHLYHSDAVKYILSLENKYNLPLTQATIMAGISIDRKINSRFNMLVNKSAAWDSDYKAWIRK